ncbi:lipopolysaccharide biosynthesis protein [Chitinispirillales bacterium ANBcel5]|uniref:lipopolysaccharide biosynthesis protein n=1 Tax=Cellulosispirillum alkaliphilum TaxID=3039283 RepID=UPI002A4FD722|nr:lipopolysaccharide biosynthesis protein [Chitinispirillales bacterium ANBcel5]
MNKQPPISSENRTETDSKQQSYGLITARSTVVITIAKLIRYGFAFFTQALLINLLTPVEFGLIKYVTVILGVVNVISTSGLTTAIIQKKELTDKEIGPLFLFNGIFCLFLYCILYSAAPYLSTLFSVSELTSLIRVGSLAVPIGGASTVHRALMQRRLKFKTHSMIEITSAIISSLCSLIFALIGLGVWALIWSLLIFHLFNSLISFIVLRELKIKNYQISFAFPIILSSSVFMLQKIIGYFNTNIDNLIIGRVFGPETLGVYTISYDIISIPNIAFGVVLTSVLLSVFSRLQDDNKRISTAYCKIMLFVTSISTIYYVLIGICSAELIATITFFRPNNNWDQSISVLRYLSILGITYAYSGYPGFILIPKKKLKLLIIWYSMMFILASIAVVIGSNYGVEGVCAALIAKTIITIPILMYILKKVAQISPVEYLYSLLPSFVCALFSAVIILGVQFFFTNVYPLNDFFRLLLCAGIGLVVYMCLFLLLFRNKVNLLINYLKPQK